MGYTVIEPCFGQEAGVGRGSHRETLAKDTFETWADDRERAEHQRGIFVVFRRLRESGDSGVFRASRLWFSLSRQRSETGEFFGETVRSSI
jgi:hypothetical protein